MKNAAPQRFAASPLALEISRIFRPGVAAATWLAMPFALAAPQGGAVTAGQAAIAQNGNTTTITQASQRAAIDWRSFNVGSQETVNFVQPNSSSAILNRVVGNEASAIFGRITANGQVYLINPNGILFGRTAQVDVGALTATTSNIGNADFMAGRLSFSQPGKPGARVENQGSITVGEGGFAALVGRGVVNSGVINARLGKVALAGGDAFVLDLYGDKLVNLIVDPVAMNSLADAHGNPLAASVDHSGQIVAEGGRVQLSVATVKQLVDNLINVSGVVRATSFTQSPGQISLLGDANTRVAVSGTLETSGQVGGRIEVTGGDVALQPGAVLAATGGAGSIAVGGDWQGQGALTHAQQVRVAAGSLIDTSAGTHGTGGTVALWSTDSTQFAGRIEARGGSFGGDGGQVEVSSKGRLGFMGDVNVSAIQGQQGSLLLDPANLRIGSVTSGDSEISADQIRFYLTRGTNVSLSADQNVVVDAEVNGLVSGGGGVSGGGLTLTAGNNLTVNQNIVLNDGALNLTATNGTLSQADGTVLYTGSGAATLSGGAGVNLGQVLSGGAVDIRSASGTVNVRNALVSASANGSAAPLTSLNVDGAGAVSLNGALVQGNATVRSRNAGVSLAGAVIQSNAGNVQVNAGTTLTSAASNIGLVAGGTVSASAGQAIDLGAVISTGTASLTSTSGGVTVRQAVTGGSTAASGGLTVNAAGNVALAGVNAGAGGINITTSSGNITSQGAGAGQGGLLSAGGVTLRASAGQAGTSGAQLNVQATAGNVLIDGNTGVNLATLLGRGTVTLSAGAGGVTVGTPIAADAGAVNASTTARPTGIAVTARDAIDVSGAVAGSGGISIDSTAGSVTLRSSSLFSEGAVNVAAAGALTLNNGAGIATTTGNGSVSLTSRGSTVTLGNAGIRAEGDAVNISLTSQADLAVNGDVQTRSGAIDLRSTQGAVRVLASTTGNDAAQNATLDAGADTTRSVITVRGAGDVELGEMIAYNRVQITSDTGNVTLKRGLGGNASGSFGGNPVLLNTGYVDYARGYLAQYRPNVGRLVINAPQGSVELNGLNLDGNANATDTTAGLSVTAGRRIVSNNEIAVNKGDIELTGGNTQATDGVYLGNSVYSRGFDSVGADGVRGGSDDQKIGYGIRINGRVLALFDNTAEMAQLPVNTFTVSWYEAGPGTPPPSHQVLTDAAGFVVDAAGLRIRSADGSYQLVGVLSSVATPVASDLHVFNVTADRLIAPGYAQAGQRVLSVQGEPSVIVVAPPPAPPPHTPVVQLQEVAKIEVANNVANYQDPTNVGTLVAASSGLAANRRVEIGAGTIAGVANHTPQTPMRLGDPAPELTELSQTPIVSAPTTAGVIAATRGIGLKVLGFLEAGDQSSAVWGSTVQVISAGGGDPFFARIDESQFTQLTRTSMAAAPPVDGIFSITLPALATRTFTVGGQTRTEIRVLANGSTATHTFQIAPGTAANNFRETVTLLSTSLANASTSGLPGPDVLPAAGASNVSGWTVTAWREQGATGTLRLISPTLATVGTANGVSVASTLAGGQPLQSGATLSPTFFNLEPDLRQLTPFSGNPVPLSPLAGIPQGYQMMGIMSDAVPASSAGRTGTRVFVYDGVIKVANGASITDSNSGVAIPGLGGIPGFNNSTVGFAGVGAGFGSLAGGTTTATGAGGASGQGVGGVTIPAAQTGTGTPPPAAPTPSGEVEVAVLPVAGDTTAPGVPAGQGDVLFGVGPAAQADLGRGGAVPGSAVNVFKRRYKVATAAPSSTVCAPDAVQTAPADGAPVRDCPAAK
jgi:filamentous hemagglutinin family protein